MFSAAVNWGAASELGELGETNRLTTLIKKVGSVTGCRLNTFKAVMWRRSLSKLLPFMDNCDYPMLHLLDRQQSSLYGQTKNPLYLLLFPSGMFSVFKMFIAIKRYTIFIYHSMRQ